MEVVAIRSKIDTYIIALVSVALILTVIITFVLRPTRMERTERHFVRDYELLMTTAHFLMDSSHRHVHFWRREMENGEKVVFNVGRIEIDDIAVVEALQELGNRGYNVIVKDGNAITFQRWANRHTGWGMAFSIDGNEPTLSSVTIVTLEPLSKPSWYFYVSQ